MGKEIFNWKNLFINQDSNASNQEIKPSVSTDKNHNQTTFPNNQTTFPTESLNNVPVSSTGITNPFLDEIFKVYEKGFESLNSTGFDFFELYKSVMAVGASNPQSYIMGFTMGKTINPTLTKEFLLEKAKYYISEIEKVYEKYDAAGKSKRVTLENNITTEKRNLSKTIEDLELKIAQLNSELEAKRAEHQKIDSQNNKEFTEIQLKIDANTFAKHKILDSINTVVTGINQYL
jgi:outer membrane murein-binding lipoprotein Lpp